MNRAEKTTERNRNRITTNKTFCDKEVHLKMCPLTWIISLTCELPGLHACAFDVFLVKTEFFVRLIIITKYKACA